jgi:hypothetical protein
MARREPVGMLDRRNPPFAQPVRPPETNLERANFEDAWGTRESY